VDDALRASWAQFLESLEWDYFLTVTFRDALPAHRADSVLNAIERTLVARCAPDAMFLGMELHVSRFLHCHGLYRTKRKFPSLGYLAEDSTSWLTEVLFRTFGRSKVEIIRSPADTAKYVTKYCIKAVEAYHIWNSGS